MPVARLTDLWAVCVQAGSAFQDFVVTAYSVSRGPPGKALGVSSAGIKSGEKELELQLGL